MARPTRFVDQVGDPVEICADALVPLGGRAAPSERAEEVKPIGGVLEQAMEVDACDVALAKPEAAIQVCLDVSVGDRLAEVDLIPLDPAAVRGTHSRPSCRLLAGEGRLDVEQSQPLGRSPLDPLGIADPPAQHLQAAADPQGGDASSGQRAGLTGESAATKVLQ